MVQGRQRSAENAQAPGDNTPTTDAEQTTVRPWQYANQITRSRSRVDWAVEAARRFRRSQSALSLGLRDAALRLSGSVATQAVCLRPCTQQTLTQVQGHEQTRVLTVKRHKREGTTLRRSTLCANTARVNPGAMSAGRAQPKLSKAQSFPLSAEQHGAAPCWRLFITTLHPAYPPPHDVPS